jgi:hypothetical protein
MIVMSTIFKLNYTSETREGSWDSLVGIATGYRLDDRGVGVRVPVSSSIFFSPQRLDWLWGPPSFLSNGYQGHFPRGLSGRSMNLTIYL